MDNSIRLGVSGCLLGQKVRYDGHHSRACYIADIWRRQVECLPICPETEAGFGVPRQMLRLVGRAGGPRLVTVEGRTDQTERLRTWIHNRLAELALQAPHGFILKARSPSCGLKGVKLYSRQGKMTRSGTGLFAAALSREWPLVPVIDDEAFHDAGQRDAFLEKLFVLRRWRHLVNRDMSRTGLQTFHAEHDLLLRAHSKKQAGETAALVQEPLPVKQLFPQYQQLLLQALALPATPQKHERVLRHLVMCCKKLFAPQEKKMLRELLEAFGRRSVPLNALLTVMQYHLRQYNLHYLAGQHYFLTDPRERYLRWHI
jgi:uncharacterized protein YbbK (DUF523 family)/uncharacterized protein YbgA (DUF1722 family)